MKRSMFSGEACRAGALIGAGLLLLSPPALAETLYLKCGAQSYSVDLEKSTAQLDTLGQGEDPVFALPAKAVISPTAIDWSITQAPLKISGNTAWAKSEYHLDRTAGTLEVVHTMWSEDGAGNRLNQADPITQTAACEKVAAPATKF